MGCYYTFKKNSNIKFSSINDAIKRWNINNKKSYDGRMFYTATEVVEKILKPISNSYEQNKKEKHSVSVTSLIKMIMNSEEGEREFSFKDKIRGLISSVIGTDIHKILESIGINNGGIKIGEVSQKIHDFLSEVGANESLFLDNILINEKNIFWKINDKIKIPLGITEEEYEKNKDEIISDLYDIIDEFKNFSNTRDSDVFKRSLSNLVDGFVENKLNVRKEKTQILTEVRFRLPINKSLLIKHIPEELLKGYDDVIYLSGMIDCIIVDDEGNIKIVDFKTHLKPAGSNYVDRMHALQLYIYQIAAREILSRLSDIKFNFSQGEIVSIYLPESFNGEIQINRAVEPKSSSMAYAFNKIDDILNIENKKEVDTNIEEVRQKISETFPRSRSYTYNKKKYKEYIVDLIKNKKDAVIVYRKKSKKDKIYVKIADSTLEKIALSNDEYIDIDEFVENQISFINNERSARVMKFKSLLSSCFSYKTGSVKESLDMLKEKIQDDSNGLSNLENIRWYLERYLYGDYKIVLGDISSTLLNLGILLLEKKSTYKPKKYTIFKLNYFNNGNELSYLDIINLNGGKFKNSNMLLGYIMSGEDFDKLPENIKSKCYDLAATRGVVELFETLAIVKNYLDGISLDSVEIEDIIAIDLANGEMAPPTDLKILSSTLDVMSKKDSYIPNNYRYTLLNRSNNLQFSDPLENYSRIIIDMYNSHYSDPEELLKENKILTISLIDEFLKKIAKDHSAEINKFLSQNQFNFDVSEMTSWQLIYVYAGILKLIKLGKYKEINSVHGVGVDKTNTFGIIHDIWKYGKINPLAAGGQTKTGVFLGTDFAVSTSNPDNLVHEVNQIMDVAMSNVMSEYQKVVVEIAEPTEKFMKQLTSTFGRVTLGNTRDVNKSLFQRSSNGSLDPLLILKNPFDKKSDLNLAQRDYIATCLWRINCFRIKNNKSIFGDNDELRKLSWNEFKKHTENYDNYVSLVNNKSDLLLIPLRKERSVGRVKSAFSSFDAIKKWGNDIVKEFNYIMDPLMLSKEERKRAEENLDKLQMYDRYGEQNRELILLNYTVDELDVNLNAITLDFVFQKMQKKYYDDALSNIKSIVGMLKMHQMITGVSQEESIEAIKKRVKISLFSQHDVSKKFESLAKIVGAGKSIASLMQIALRPKLLVKEMTVGVVKLLTKALSGYFANDGITSGDILFGMKEVMALDLDKAGKVVIGQMDPSKFTLIDQLNLVYRISNMDMNIVVEKTRYDRYGVMNLAKRAPYWTSTAPDWMNRMGVFVGYLHRIGAYEAHKINPDGSIEYDMSLDKRFSEFWKNKDKKNYKPTELFLKQKADYILMVEQFNKEGYNLVAGRKGIDGTMRYDSLPKALTNLLRMSIVEQIGTALGFYDHDQKPIWDQQTFSAFFLLYLTYWPGELKNWLGISHKKTNTSIKNSQQKRNKDGQLLYYLEDENGFKLNELGEKIETTLSEVDGKKLTPVKVWVGHPVEGLAVSFAKTVYDVFHWKETREKYKKMRANLGDEYINRMLKQLIANTKVFLFYILYSLLFAKLLAMLFGIDTDASKKEQMANEFYNTYAFFDLKVFTELSFKSSIVLPIEDLEIKGVSTLTDLIGDIVNVLGNWTEDGADRVWKNIGLFNDIMLHKDLDPF